MTLSSLLLSTADASPGFRICTMEHAHKKSVAFSNSEMRAL